MCVCNNTALFIVSPKICFKQASQWFRTFILNTHSNIILLYRAKSSWVPWRSVKLAYIGWFHSLFIFTHCKSSILLGYFVMKPEMAFVTLGWHLIIHRPHLSLILRLSHRPVFDCLSMQKLRGRSGPFYHVNDVIPQCLTTGRQRHLCTCWFWTRRS